MSWTARLPPTPDPIAPDGAAVRLLVGCRGGSMAHFSLPPGETSVAVAHRTLEELWYFVGGSGEMWRRSDVTGEEDVVTVEAGTAIGIPDRTRFQFRSTGDEPLAGSGVTMPPWPGSGELDGAGEVIFVDGPWTATVESGMTA